MKLDSATGVLLLWLNDKLYVRLLFESINRMLAAKGLNMSFENAVPPLAVHVITFVVKVGSYN